MRKRSPKRKNKVDSHKGIDIYVEGFGSVRSPTHWKCLREAYGKTLMAIVKAAGIDEFSRSEIRFGIFMDADKRKSRCYRFNTSGDLMSPAGSVYFFDGRNPMLEAINCAIGLTKGEINALGTG